MIWAWGLFLGVFGLLAVYSWFIIWSRKESLFRHVVIPILIFLIPVIIFGVANVLSWPRPARLAWDIPKDSYVLSHKIVMDEAIYLYLDVAGAPRSIYLPWDNGTAQKLFDAMMESKRNGQEGAILRFEHSWLKNIDPEFHPLPQPMTPMPKENPPPVRRYQQI